MKKKDFAKKLTLNKKDIAALTYDELNSLRGGLTIVMPTCATDAKCCPAEND